MHTKIYWIRFLGQPFARKYILKEYLGSGGFAAVFLADEIIADHFIRKIAIKLVEVESNPSNKTKINTIDLDEKIKELQLAVQLKHPCLIDHYTVEQDTLDDNPYLGLVMEIAQTSLKINQNLSKVELKGLITVIASGLAYLHSQNIVHRNIKPANLLKVNGQWKIGHSGIFYRLSKDIENVDQPIGTLAYIPPEGWEGTVSRAFDLWSLGVVTCELVTGQHPFPHDDDMIELLKILNNKEPELLHNLEFPYGEIIRGCLIKDHQKRWNAQQVLDKLKPNYEAKATNSGNNWQKSDWKALKERLPVKMSFSDGQELSITAAFLEIPGITEIEPYDSFLAIVLLHQVIQSNFKNLPVIILTSLTGAIIVVPDSFNHYIHQDLQELFSQTTQRGIPLKIGVAQGGVKVFKDADESMSFIGSPMNTAARLAKSKMNPCILYHESYKNKVAGSIKSKKEDPLHPRYGKNLTVEGKSHDPPFICFYPDSTALSIRQDIDSSLLSQFEEEYQGINKQVSAVIIAYDLPNFSGGDGTELSKRFRSVRDAIRDIKLNYSFPQEAKFHFSPGGDGGILVLEGEPLKSLRVYIDTAFDLIRGLEIESDYKDEKIAVKSRVGIHYGDVYLYNSAEGVPRPTGLNCFVADAIASDKIARESGGIVVTESIKDMMVSRVGRGRFDQGYGDLSSIAEGPSHGMNRYFKRIESHQNLSFDYSNYPPTLSRQIKSDREKQTILFQSVGPLPLNSSLYIKRKCDDDLEKAIKNQKFIAIIGEYQTGKSSLMNQLPNYEHHFNENCQSFLMSFDAMAIYDSNFFIKEFFLVISESLEREITMWRELKDILSNEFIIFKFDEFGLLSEIAEKFIPPLYALAEQTNNLRIIVSSPKPIKKLMANFKGEVIRNPKYTSQWQSIEIEKFQEEQTSKILELLSNDTIRNQALRYCGKIHQLSRGNPNKLQNLCIKLLNLSSESDIEQNIQKTIEDLNSYEPQ